MIYVTYYSVYLPLFSYKWNERGVSANENEKKCSSHHKNTINQSLIVYIFFIAVRFTCISYLQVE
nr:MAG TPA: hypothetical protein [Caudoviricetes sp.]